MVSLKYILKKDFSDGLVIFKKWQRNNNNALTFKQKYSIKLHKNYSVVWFDRDEYNGILRISDCCYYQGLYIQKHKEM